MQTAVKEVMKFDVAAFFGKFARNGKAVQIFVTAARIIRNEFEWDGSESVEEKKTNLDNVWSEVGPGLAKALTKNYKHCGTSVEGTISRIPGTDIRQLTVRCQYCKLIISIDEEGKIDG